MDRRSFSFEKGWGQRVVKWGASLRNGRWIGREGVRGLSGNRLDLWGWNIGSYTAEISHRHLTNEANSILHSLWSFFLLCSKPLGWLGKLGPAISASQPNVLLFFFIKK